MATILLKRITSSDLNVSPKILESAEPAIGQIGVKTYLVVGDGTTQIKNLPKYAADQLAEWGQITGTITAQTDLIAQLANKLDKNLGAANVGKILVVNETGNVDLIVNNFMVKPSSAASGDIGVFDANKNMVDSGKNIGDYYTKTETDSAIAASAIKEFNTDPDWEAASLTALNSWITGNTAHDPINNRDVNNYDVYLATDSNTQYYFDSGIWLPFNADMSNYYNKGETDALIDTKIPKPATAVSGNIATFDGNKNTVDSGTSLSDLSAAVAGKVNTAQGSGNANKLLGTDANGNVVIVTVIDGGEI